MTIYLFRISKENLNEFSKFVSGTIGMPDFGSDIEMSRLQGRFRIARYTLPSPFCILPILLFAFKASQPVVDTTSLSALFKDQR